MCIYIYTCIIHSFMYIYAYLKCTCIRVEIHTSAHTYMIAYGMITSLLYCSPSLGGPCALSNKKAIKSGSWPTFLRSHWAMHNGRSNAMIYEARLIFFSPYSLNTIHLPKGLITRRFTGNPSASSANCWEWETSTAVHYPPVIATVMGRATTSCAIV